MASIEELRQRMDQTGTMDDPVAKNLHVLAILTERLVDTGIRPILVGGMAVAFYTLGGYTTKDIDVIMASVPVVDQALAALGFSKQGRYWLREDIGVAIEAPASSLHGDAEHIAEVDVEDMQAYIVGVEDLIVDRLSAAVHWSSPEDSRWARRLIDVQAKRLDWDYLRRKAYEDGVADALAEIEQAIREELSHEED